MIPSALAFTAAAAPGRRETRIHIDTAGNLPALAAEVRSLTASAGQGRREVVVVCIGTDRSIGDALGPLVGTTLMENGPLPFRVLGCLEHPVHAGNLAQTVAELEAGESPPFVVAVDACLGRAESVGTVAVGVGAVVPGAGVNKRLPPVGDVYITGVVNVGGFMEYFVLQNTRLHLVMRMARLIAGGVGLGLRSALSGEHHGGRSALEAAVTRLEDSPSRWPELQA